MPSVSRLGDATDLVASWSHPLHVDDVPRGARMVRTEVVIEILSVEGRREDQKLSTARRVVK
jgi:hypothetical protein